MGGPDSGATRSRGEAVKKNAKPVLPKVLSSKFLGLYVSGACAGPGWGNPGYIQAIYEDVLETGKIQVRHGPVVRQSAYARGAAYTAFVALYTEFSTLARTIEADEE